MCVTDCLMDLSSSICNCLKPLWQLTVITYSEKLSSIMHDNYLLNSFRAGNKEDSNLWTTLILPAFRHILNLVTLGYLYSQ